MEGFLTSTELRLTPGDYISKPTRKLIRKLYLNAQSIPAVYIPAGNPWGFDHPFCPVPWLFSKKVRDGILIAGID